jgi:hypothetical protein
LGGADGIRGGDDRYALDALRVAPPGNARELVRVTLDA